jgi:hypothetical protein
MEMVELHNVPGDEIPNFIDILVNKIDDSWNWCPKYDLFELETASIRLSPYFKRLAELLEAFSSSW